MANTKIIETVLKDYRAYTPDLANEINRAIDGYRGEQQYRAVDLILHAIRQLQATNLNIQLFKSLGLVDSLPRSLRN